MQMCFASYFQAGDEVNSGADSGAEGNAEAPAAAGGSTLWQQMMAREGREAARPSGVRAGDWQAERQLQEALRESRQVGLLCCRPLACVLRSYGVIHGAVVVRDFFCYDTAVLSGRSCCER